MMKTRYRLLEYIKEYFENHCYAPSYDEMAAGIGVKSKCTVSDCMKKLFDEGLIETDMIDSYGIPRAFRPAGYVARSMRTKTSEEVIS